MSPLLWHLASLLLRTYCWLARPSSATVPPGWLIMGIRPSGAYTAVRSPVGDPNQDGTYGTVDVSIQPDGELDARIYCNSTPIVVDERHVACRGGQS